MIPSESSSPDPHVREDGGSIQTGWRMPRTLVREVQALAAREGVRPSRLVSQILLLYLGRGPHVYTAAELESRIKFPEHLFHGKWR